MSMWKTPAPSKAVGDSQAYSSLTGRPPAAGMTDQRMGQPNATDIKHVPNADGGKSK